MQRQRDALWPLSLMVAIFVVSGASHLATPDINLAFSKDKLAHCLLFGLIATAIIRIPSVSRRGWYGVAFAACLASVYGGLDELRQSLTPGRSVEIADWVADTFGATLAAVLYRRWRWYRALLERQLFPRKQKNHGTNA